MTDPFLLAGRNVVMDTYARQLAMEALRLANTCSGGVAALTPSVGGPVVVGPLSLGASAQITIPFTPAITGSYVPLPSLYGTATLLAGLTLAGVTAQTSTSVTVTVKAGTLAVAAGATVGVVCFRTT